MPGDSGVLVVTRVRSTTTKCTRGCGCSGHPAFPTPSLGERFINASGAWRGEVANVYLELGQRHCERSEEAIQSPSFRDGPQDQTSDVLLHIGESRDSGFDAEP